MKLMSLKNYYEEIFKEDIIEERTFAFKTECRKEDFHPMYSDSLKERVRNNDRDVKVIIACYDKYGELIHGRSIIGAIIEDIVEGYITYNILENSDNYDMIFNYGTRSNFNNCHFVSLVDADSNVETVRYKIVSIKETEDGLHPVNISYYNRHSVGGKYHYKLKEVNLIANDGEMKMMETYDERTDKIND